MKLDDLRRTITPTPQPAQPKPWPSYAIAELKRHMRGLPDTDLFYSEDHLFRGGQ